MLKMMIMVPTRGRPLNLYRLLQVPRDTTTGILVLVDADDPTLPLYRDVLHDRHSNNPLNPTLRHLVLDQHLQLGPKLNHGARWITENLPEVPILGFLGDDHMPRTWAWDDRITDAFGPQLIRSATPTGVVYPNDLYQGDNLPTCVFIRADIVHTLGYFAAPGIQHLYLDDAWRDLGADAGCLHYLPFVTVEHCHPHAGTAATDEQYERVNSPAQYARDSAAYRSWRERVCPSDAARIRKLLQENPTCP